MKIAPLKVSDPWFGRIVNNDTVQADSLLAVPIESTVEMELVELLHGGPEDNYRPYLHLRGELTEAKPAVELPYGVTELTMRTGSGLTIDAFYDFNQRQLSDLVSKGYFTDKFKVPDEMSGIPWTLPGKADFLVVAPELSDQPPLVFMNVHEQNELALDEANSGYELSAYFPDYTLDAEQQAAAETAIDAPEHSGSSLDMFSNESFEERRPGDLVAPAVGAVEPEQRTSVPVGVFERLVSEIEAQQHVEPEPIEEPAPAGVIPGSAEDVYLSRVSPGVEQVFSGESVETVEGDASVVVEADELESDAVSSKGFLDLSEPEPELTPLALQSGVEGDDEQAKAAERRNSRIRNELAGDESDASVDEDQPVL